MMDSWRSKISISKSRDAMARTAADYAAQKLSDALKRESRVRLIAATGAAQMEFLKYLTKTPGLDWARVELFHLDEYVGIGSDHPASFARYIRERIIQPTGIPTYHLLDGLGDPAAVIQG